MRIPAWRRGLNAALFVALGALASSAQQVPQDSVWTETPDRGHVFATWSENGTPYYAIRADGEAATVALSEAEHRVLLRYAKFDPLEKTPAVPETLTATSASKLFIVQYATQGLASYRRALRDLGVEVLQFIPTQGNLVRMDAATVAAVEDQNFVRWVGPFHPAYRLEEELLEGLANRDLGTLHYNIHVTRKGLVEKSAVREFITRLGGAPHAYTSPHGFLLRATLTPSQLVAVAHRDDVLFIDRWSDPSQTDMDNARQLFGANYVESVGGYTGLGLRAEVRDTGLNDVHTDFQATPVIYHTGTAVDSHGTATYGINFGDGTTDPAARGMVPDAQGIFAVSNQISDRYTHTQELNGAFYQAVYQTSSVGSTRTFFYTNISANLDNILFDLDTIKTQSQSNAGDQDSRPEAWAKNIVSGGGIRHFNTLTTADDSWTGGASIGPAQDGRIKPDLCAFYDATLTTTTGSSTAYTPSFGGTSGATPIIAGNFGHFFQMWADGLFGNPVDPAGTIFSNRPHMTTSKAMMLNTATQYPFSGTSHDLTRVHQGWGRPDLQTLFDQQGRFVIINETDLLRPFETRAYQVLVQPTDGHFQATLVFADPPGNPAAAQARVNDLTLRVVAPSGQVYWGNFGLLANTASLPGGSPNTVDTVEQVIIPNPTPGVWEVSVLCADLVEDGHVETAALDADYALVIRGADPITPTGNPTGQANSIQSSLSILGATNANGQPASLGVNGPFSVQLNGLGTLGMHFTGPANFVFFLLAGPVNANNVVFGGVGSLDLGTMGAANLGDVNIVLNGFTPVGLLDTLASVGPNGAQTLVFPVPPSVTGNIGGFQAAMLNPNNTASVVLSAAFEVNN